jgi:hypothetical protein
MRQAQICMPSSLLRVEHHSMDIVAVLIGILMFSILIAAIYGIERI